MFCRLLLCFAIFSSLSGVSLSTLTLAPAMQEVVRYVNESYVVTCIEMSRGAVSWWKGDRNAIALGDKGHPHVSAMGAGTGLVFEKITAEDRGQYTCKSQQETAAFKLIVISPISFMGTPSTQKAREHHPATVHCLVKGDPKPKVLWKFDGKDVAPPKFKPTQDGLKIENVSLEDRGTYTCRAYQVSQVTSMYEEKNINLIVQHKPMLKKPVYTKVNKVYGYVGGEANLTCEAEAEPAASFTWFRPHKKLTTMPGRILQERHWSTLHLYIKNADVFGSYLCKATNELGTLDQIISLNEGVKPPPPQLVRVRGATSDTLDVEIRGPELNQSQLPLEMLPTGFRLQYKPPTDKWTEAALADFTEINEGGLYIISGLSHNTAYEVRGATRNIAGLSDYTTPVLYNTLRLQADSITAASTSNVAIHLVVVLLGAIALYTCVIHL